MQVLYTHRALWALQEGGGGNAAAFSGPGSITGVIIDSATQKKIDYASIAIYKDNGTRPLNGGITNSEGPVQYF